MIHINDDYKFWLKKNARTDNNQLYSSNTDFLILNESKNKIVIKGIFADDLEILINISKLEIKKNYKKNVYGDFKEIDHCDINNNFPNNSIEYFMDIDNSTLCLMFNGVDKLTDDKMIYLPKHYYCTKYGSIGSYVVNGIHLIKYLNFFIKKRIFAKIKAIGRFLIIYKRIKTSYNI